MRAALAGEMLGFCAAVRVRPKKGLTMASTKTNHRRHHDYDYHHSHHDDDYDDDDYDDDVGHQNP